MTDRRSARIVTAGQVEEHDLRRADRRVGDGELEPGAPERARHAESSTSIAAMAANIAMRTPPSSGSTVLVSQA